MLRPKTVHSRSTCPPHMVSRKPQLSTVLRQPASVLRSRMCSGAGEEFCAKAGTAFFRKPDRVSLAFCFTPCTARLRIFPRSVAEFGFEHHWRDPSLGKSNPHLRMQFAGSSFVKAWLAKVIVHRCFTQSKVWKSVDG